VQTREDEEEDEGDPPDRFGHHAGAGVRGVSDRLAQVVAVAARDGIHVGDDVVVVKVRRGIGVAVRHGPGEGRVEAVAEELHGPGEDGHVVADDEVGVRGQANPYSLGALVERAEDDDGAAAVRLAMEISRIRMRMARKQRPLFAKVTDG
jgi:hypothetical protein